MTNWYKRVLGLLSMQAGTDVIRKIVVAKQLAPEGFTSIPGNIFICPDYYW